MANFVVPMHSAYPRTSIAMDTTTAPMRVTRRIARPSRVLTTNSCAPTAGQTKRQNASRNLSYAMENVTAKMERMKRRLARQHRVPPWAVNISVDRRLLVDSVTARPDEPSRTTTRHVRTLTSASSGVTAISFAQTPTGHSHVFAHLATL